MAARPLGNRRVATDDTTPAAADGLVFTNTRGAPIQQYPFSQAWATARAKTNVPHWATPHDLRHHYASVLIQSGASVKVLQARLGHGSAKVTLDSYGHLFPDEEDRTRVAVDDAFASAATRDIAVASARTAGSS